MKKKTIEVEVYHIGNEKIMIFPSGYKGIQIAVSEDPAYNISAWYPTKEQIKVIEDFEKEGIEDWKEKIYGKKI